MLKISRPLLLTDKRLVLVTLLLALLASAFWAGSRVPALNEKALLGGETQLDALGFEMVIEPQPDDPIALRAAYTTINWTQTNLKGMTFGVLFGVGLMTLLSILRKKSFQSDFANALLGMTLGSQLGVCVNCAAPIAHELRSAGAPVPIMLASMMSSPTLNIIVLSMLFSLFPLYMVLIKIGLTVGFVLIVIPILSRLLAKDATVGLEGAYCEVPTGPPGGDAILKWGPATTWVWRNFGKNLWYIVRTTVPLMLLAGFLGSLMVRVLPLDSLANLFPEHGKVGILSSMGILALIGLFLPVPIAFDVIVTLSLLSAGMPPMYAMVLLFTLGIFSVYALFIIWKSLPKTLILGVSFSLFGLGVTSGLLGYYGFEWNHQRELKIFFEAFGQESTLAGPTVIKINRREPSLPDRTLVSRLLATAVPPEPVAMDTPPGISIHRAAFRPRTTQPGKPFIRLEGAELGLDEPYTFSVHNFLWLSRFRGIASGDVHNDGWVDIVLASDTGVSLYANQQGAGYVRQPIEFPVSSKPHAVNVALVDLNNDGWLDIFFSCYRDGNYVIYNQLGNFRIEDLHPIPNYAGAVMSAAVTFGDVDRDGDLDIALGNWSAGDFVRSPQSLPSSRNILLHNEGGGFRVEPLKGIVGETLSMLLSDFNNDGYLDLVEGNDFSPPDYYNLGNGDGTFKMLTRTDGVIPYSAQSTMSISSADIDNDLRPEIYLGQISGRMGSGNRELTRVGPHLCAELVDPEYRRYCERIMTVQSEIIKNKNKKSVAGCLELDEEYRDDCLGVLLFLSAVKWNQDLCDLFGGGWQTFWFFCKVGHQEPILPHEAELTKSIAQHHGTNVLLMPAQEGRFVDQAKTMGVENGGWTWNAKFADLDNGEWQDLYVVNGELALSTREPHIFYHNQQGKRFIARTEEYGLNSLFATSSYSYVDIDNDEDLDVVSVPAAGPILVYRNNSVEGNSIAFEIRDQVGNRFGVGSRIIVHYGQGEGRQQMREIQASGGFVSFDAPIAYFGLGDFDRVSRVEIVWSTGEHSEIRGDFLAGARYIFRRGG